MYDVPFSLTMQFFNFNKNGPTDLPLSFLSTKYENFRDVSDLLSTAIPNVRTVN